MNPKDDDIVNFLVAMKKVRTFDGVESRNCTTLEQKKEIQEIIQLMLFDAAKRFTNLEGPEREYFQALCNQYQFNLNSIGDKLNVTSMRIMYRSLDDMDMMVGTYAAFNNAGMSFVGDIAQHTKEELQEKFGVAPKYIKDANLELARFGLRIGMPIDFHNQVPGIMPRKETMIEKQQRVLDLTLDELDFSLVTKLCLQKWAKEEGKEQFYLGDIVSKPIAELKAHKSFGPDKYIEVSDVAKAYGFVLGIPVRYIRPENRKPENYLAYFESLSHS